MCDDNGKRQATLLALLDLKDAVARGDVEEARQGREKRLLMALELFSTDRKRHDALQQVWDASGRWLRHIGSADMVMEALGRAIPLFERRYRQNH
jgi:hypothetical protein